MSGELVVGWNGSPASQRALAWTIERAQRTREAIIMVNVVDLGTSLVADEIVERAVAAEHIKTDGEAQQVANHNRWVRVNTHIVTGDPLSKLLAFTRSDNLTVVGTDHRRGPRSLYRWSLGARLTAAAQGAIAVVPDAGTESAPGVIVGVDGSDVSLKAARVAAAEARQRQETLHVVHAWLEPMVDVPGRYLDDDLVAELEREHQILLDSAVHSIGRSHPELTVHSHLIHDDPHHALNTVISKGASTVVLGNRHVHGLARFLLGSVSHTMILDIQLPTISVSARYEI